MAWNYGTPQPKPLPKVADKMAAKRAAEREDRAAKADIKARDKFQCRCCGRKESLDVHERKTRGAGGTVSRANSLTLCRLCHQLAQQYRIQIEGESCDGKLLFTMAQRIADLVFPHGRIPKQVHVVGDGV